MLFHIENGLSHAKPALIHTRTIMHPAIKLRHIRAFLDIAAEGSLSAVARLRGLTQPGLSRSLAELEDLLGQALFAREGRRLVLTDAGRLFRRHATLAVEALEAGAAALHPGEGAATIHVGILPTVAAGLFPRVALRFRALMPNVSLNVETGPNVWLLRRLREGSLDLMVGRMPAASEMVDLAFEHLYEEPVVLCARAGHPGIWRPVRDLIRDHPLILPSPDAIIRRIVDDYLVTLGLSGLRPAFETVSLAFGRGILMASDALWFISRGVVAQELARGDLIMIETGAGFLSGAIGVTRHQNIDAQPFLHVVLDILRELAEEEKI